jgi:hypothetical protein
MVKFDNNLISVNLLEFPVFYKDSCLYQDFLENATTNEDYNIELQKDQYIDSINSFDDLIIMINIYKFWMLDMSEKFYNIIFDWVIKNSECVKNNFILIKNTTHETYNLIKQIKMLAYNVDDYYIKISKQSDTGYLYLLKYANIDTHMYRELLVNSLFCDNLECYKYIFKLIKEYKFYNIDFKQSVFSCSIKCSKYIMNLLYGHTDESIFLYNRKINVKLIREFALITNNEKLYHRCYNHSDKNFEIIREDILFLLYYGNKKLLNYMLSLKRYQEILKDIRYLYCIFVYYLKKICLYDDILFKNNTYIVRRIFRQINNLYFNNKKNLEKLTSEGIVYFYTNNYYYTTIVENEDAKTIINNLFSNNCVFISIDHVCKTLITINPKFRKILTDTFIWKSKYSDKSNIIEQIYKFIEINKDNAYNIIEAINKTSTSTIASIYIQLIYNKYPDIDLEVIKKLNEDIFNLIC